MENKRRHQRISLLATLGLGDGALMSVPSNHTLLGEGEQSMKKIVKNKRVHKKLKNNSRFNKNGSKQRVKTKGSKTRFKQHLVFTGSMDSLFSRLSFLPSFLPSDTDTAAQKGTRKHGGTWDRGTGARSCLFQTYTCTFLCPFGSSALVVPSSFVRAFRYVWHKRARYVLFLW